MLILGLSSPALVKAKEATIKKASFNQKSYQVGDKIIFNMDIEGINPKVEYINVAYKNAQTGERTNLDLYKNSQGK